MIEDMSKNGRNKLNMHDATDLFGSYRSFHIFVDNFALN